MSVICPDCKGYDIDSYHGASKDDYRYICRTCAQIFNGSGNEVSTTTGKFREERDAMREAIRRLQAENAKLQEHIAGLETEGLKLAHIGQGCATTLEELHAKYVALTKERAEWRDLAIETQQLLHYSVKHEWLQKDEAKNARIAELLAETGEK